MSVDGRAVAGLLALALSGTGCEGSLLVRRADEGPSIVVDLGSRDDAGRRDTGVASAADGGGADGGDRDAGGGPPDAGPAPRDAGPDLGPVDAGPPPPCDYRTVDGVLVIEAESLPLVEQWAVRTDEPGYLGTGFIEWTGSSHNGDPTHGVMVIDVDLEQAGRYRLQWRNRIGEGTNTTEHNDTWVRFADAADFFGSKGPLDAQQRVYPRPQCGDGAFLAGIEALADVASAACVAGSSRDGWLKVYSSGARDWRWSTRTNDHDAHDVIVEVDAPGVYAFELAARADHHLIDRIVLHEASVPDGTVRDEANRETRCR